MKHIFKLFILILCCSPVFADVIYLNEGEEYTGKLLAVKDGKITFDALQNGVKEFSQTEIAHILISKVRDGDEISHVKEITDPLVTEILGNLPNYEDYPEANYITLHRRNEFRFTAAGERILNSREIIMILKEPGLEQANNSIYYFTDREECELKFAHTYSADGNVYHLTDDAISLETMRSGTPEYARLRKLKFAMKKVDIGSIIDYCYERKLSGIDAINPRVTSYIFGEREPVLKEELIIEYDESMDFRRHLFQWPENAPIQFSETKKDGKVAWSWIYSDMQGYIPEQNMLPGKRVFPRVVAFAHQPWETTAAMLAEAYEKARPESQALQDLIKKAEISDKMSDYEKVAALYDLINKEIRDVGVSINQMGGFAPVSTQITLNKKYGNAQNSLALLHFALEALGIESQPGFCSDKREKVTLKDYANLALTDYAVIKIIIDGEEFFSDGGSIYRPFGTVSTGLQGATAGFLDLKKKEFSFGELPKSTFDWNRYERNVLVEIKDNGDMDVKEIVHFRGPYESNIRELKSIKDQEKRNYAEKRVKQVHPNAILDGFGFTAMENLNSPAVLTLRYRIPGAAQKASDKIMTFTNFWVNYHSSSASLMQRKYPMQYWSTEENSQTIVFYLPENFTWVPWGRQYNFSSGLISFSSNMNQHESQLIYADRFVARDDEFVSDGQYQNYRNCILTMSELANQWIIIERTERPVDAAVIGPVDPSENASAASLLNNASATSGE